MPLQTSGTISLNDIHVEAGGSSGSQASLNDADIRALIGKSSGAQMGFSEWYGASANWTATVTIGILSAGKLNVYGYNAGTYGSISDTTINSFGNRTINSVFWNGSSAGVTIPGAPNSGWTRFIIHSTSFYRTQATHFNSSTGMWLWSTTTNPFAAISGTRTVQMII